MTPDERYRLAMREAEEIPLDELRAAADFYQRHVVQQYPQEGGPLDDGLVLPARFIGEQGHGETCPVCGGRGWATLAPDSRDKLDCTRCGGDGVIWVRP